MSELSMLTLFEKLGNKYQQLLAQNRLSFTSYTLGNHLMRVGYSDQLQSILGGSVQHLIARSTDHADLEIICMLMDQDFVIPFEIKDYLVQGLLAGYNDADHFSMFQHGANVFSFYDRKARRGYYVIQNPEILPYWEKGAPFRSIIHWWTEETTYQLLHAAFIEYDGVGILFSGKGGSGKSSTTIGALLKGRKTLGDDYLLIDTQDTNVYSLYQTAKLDHHAFMRFPRLQDQLAVGELPTGSKALIPINEVMPGAMCFKGTAHFHFLPRISNAPRTLINQTSGAEALRALAPSTLFQLPRLQELTFKKCGKVCRKIPAFEILLGTEPEEIDAAIVNFVKLFE